MVSTQKDVVSALRELTTAELSLVAGGNSESMDGFILAEGVEPEDSSVNGFILSE